MTDENGFSGWKEEDRSYLDACLAEVQARLRLIVARKGAEPDAAAASSEKEQAEQDLQEAVQRRQEAEGRLSRPSSLQMLCQAFSLTTFECDLLLLCAAVELDPSSAALCASRHGDPKMHSPTFALAAIALPEAHWRAVAPDAPLRRWHFIELGKGDFLATSPLRIDERVLHHLLGIDYLDERLRGLTESISFSSDLAATQLRQAERIRDAWSASADYAWPLIQLCGSEGAGSQAIAAFACASLGVQLCSLQAADIPNSAAEREDLARLWEREAVLSHVALMVRCEDLEDKETGSALSSALSFLRRVRGMVLATSRRPLPLRLFDRATLHLDVNKPAPEEQEKLWRKALDKGAWKLDGQLEQVISQFNLAPQEILDASAEVLALQESDEERGREREGQREGQRDFGALLRKACKAAARPRLDELADRIEPSAAWDDLVLPEAQQQILLEIEAQVRHSGKVYRKWGFASKGGRGLGISALFAGESGTGKTMAAEVLAGRLDLDLYRIDLSQVVNKYIGETEKNLRKVFDAAEGGGCILLFDEADALFGKRSDVKDSHDRYANIEVGYLLQRMEAFRGLAILTTNIRGALDRAFLRRIRFIVQFPFPGEAERKEIWRRIFPEQTPRNGLDYEKLARLNVTGGSIRNMALYSAFLAADEDAPVSMRHLLRATKVEFGKLERPLSGTEIEGWV
jgi:SpoVK/Ycf46/Vps4 family AAA+-type ATPase